MGRWIVTDEIDELARTLLTDMGEEVDWQPGIGREELLEVIGRYDGMVISSRTNVDGPLIDNGVRLKTVARVGSGMEHVDRARCREAGIVYLNSPEGNANAVAEHAVGMLLCLIRNITKADAGMRRFSWQREANRGIELHGCSVGIVGYGHTGSAFAGKFRNWGVRLLAHDKYLKGFEDEYVQAASLDEILKHCDVISFHLPYTQETHHLINEDLIMKCSRQPVLINTSRGSVADTAAVLEGLKQGRIRGCCLDVFEDEPPGKGISCDRSLYEELFAREDVILTPHIAGWTHRSKIRLVEVLIDKVRESLQSRGLC